MLNATIVSAFERTAHGKTNIFSNCSTFLPLFASICVFCMTVRAGHRATLHTPLLCISASKSVYAVHTLVRPFRFLDNFVAFSNSRHSECGCHNYCRCVSQLNCPAIGLGRQCRQTALGCHLDCVAATVRNEREESYSTARRQENPAIVRMDIFAREICWNIPFEPQ